MANRFRQFVLSWSFRLFHHIMIISNRRRSYHIQRLPTQYTLTNTFFVCQLSFAYGIVKPYHFNGVYLLLILTIIESIFLCNKFKQGSQIKWTHPFTTVSHRRSYLDLFSPVETLDVEMEMRSQDIHHFPQTESYYSSQQTIIQIIIDIFTQKLSGSIQSIPLHYKHIGYFSLQYFTFLLIIVYTLITAVQFSYSMLTGVFFNLRCMKTRFIFRMVFIEEIRSFRNWFGKFINAIFIVYIGLVISVHLFQDGLEGDIAVHIMEDVDDLQDLVLVWDFNIILLLELFQILIIYSKVVVVLLATLIVSHLNVALIVHE